uniref:Transposase MuDR plant domain-containing protein n=1 Tax=Arundo donax TaxID=35708 RepID=A0A0A9G375_ARUDO
MSDEQMYVALGLRAEDERVQKAAQEGDIEGATQGVGVQGGAAQGGCAQGGAAQGGAAARDDTHGAAIPVEDYAPLQIIYDKDNPKFKLGTMFPNMKEFKLAVRQWAINTEFELATEKSCKTKFRGYKEGYY